MNNQQTVTMVPAKGVKYDLKTETNTIVYMPLATTENPGVVRIGEGLKIDVDGLLSCYIENDSITSDKIAIGAVTDDKIVSVSGNKVIGPVEVALVANSAINDSTGNVISDTYRKISDSYNREEIDLLIKDAVVVENLPTIAIYGGFDDTLL